MSTDTKKYEEMSPFELKNILIKMAQECSAKQGKSMLNAGRGNPNFLNTTVRKAFSFLNLFASSLSEEEMNMADLGLRPSPEGIAKKLKKYLYQEKGLEEVEFLERALDYAEQELDLDADSFVYELSDAILGDFYPSPPRIFPSVEKVVNAYLTAILSPNYEPAKGTFDLFATEGATAAMVYVFASLKENKLLNYGDHIAIITPIFSPYLEIPALNDYRLVQIYVEESEDLDWQIPDSEVEKLKDPRIKALFMVHPTNPTAVKLKSKTLDRIADLIKSEREDLIVLTDTVYATFVDDFRSFVEVVPENTICVYSFSKFFGVTGWRLGVIMLHENSVVDRLIHRLSEKQIQELDKRYRIDATFPEKIKFIDRLEIDSRDVALAHTGGISCPQQCIMCLFCLFYLIDKKLEYKKSIQAILKRRIDYLYDNLGITYKKGPDHTYYYTLIDIGRMAADKYGKEFARYLGKNVTIVDFLFRLAQERSTVCLPGEGFAGPKWSIRVSLANLADEDYVTIGNNICDVLEDYFKNWQKGG